ncbi:MAG: MiaB/RimO family radical SAM methylthiotransferase [Candidatus Spyradenecus sp.]
MFAAPAIAFRVFGCRLNQAEAAAWQEALATRGFPIVPPEAADVLCLHSCAVTAPAEHEAAKFLRAFRQRHPQARVILSGCAAELAPRAWADLILPHARKAEWLTEVLAFLATLPPAPAAPQPPPRAKTRTALIIQDGCDRFCAYCIVPHLRGAPTSVPMRTLLAEARERFARGYREIVLTGCHLALYRDPESGAGLLDLLARLCEVPGEGRLRLSSIEPGVVDLRALARLIAASDGRLCPFLHLPIQCAADSLLARMGRPYSERDLRAGLDAILETLPFCGLGADWIAGLPGESETEAAASQRLLADYPFLGAHIFPYSPRPGTPAATFPDQLPPELRQRRAADLAAIAAESRLRAQSRFLGRELIVIPERLRNGTWEGWSAERLRCRLGPNAQRGTLTPFRLESLASLV